MNQDLVYKPRVVIEGAEVVYLTSCKLKISSSTLNQLDVTFQTPEIKSSKLFGKVIEFYLNAGSEDGFPIFSGYIKQTNKNESSVSVKAVDVRGFLQDKAHTFELTDEFNYDGYTISGFLKKYITEHINIESVIIDTSYLNDTSPKTLLTGMRGDFTPYSLVNDALLDNVDSSDLSEPLDYSIGVIRNGIFFIKKKRLSSIPALTLSETDGIKSYNYSERIQKYSATYGNKILKYGSNPSGPFTLSTKIDKDDDPAVQRNSAYIQLIKELKNTQEIKVKAVKGHYTNLESIVWLESSDSNLSGPHRLTAKDIKISKNNITLELTLSKKPIVASSYI